ncbi:AsmA family protein [Pedobacter montanisoli]|uniref:DUF748 domain-containing protein n=1 Tax=Pedobacter montanisoli TaxID=2923277 RepID=A0ABS9ZU76_9SPHI|nr:hypothetical protein [Pedobacter montanisoli]MCJ0742155.1 hypothetical protein [Pedobacter montanisoli]
MPQKAKMKLLYKVLALVVGSLLLLYGVSVLIFMNIKPRVREELKLLIKDASGKLYDIDFKDINANLLTGNATLRDVTLNPDTNTYKQLVTNKKAPNNLYQIKLKKLTIKQFHPFRLFFKKEIEIGLLRFDYASISMNNKAFEFNENKPSRPEISPYHYIKSICKSFHVDKIEFRNAFFEYVDKNGLKPETDTIANLNITLTDWLIDSLSAKDESRTFLLKDIQIYLNNYSYATPDSLYYIKLSQLDFSVTSKKVNIKNFEVQPRYSEADFAHKVGMAQDRYLLNLNNINLTDIDILAYIRRREIIAKQMNIADGTLSVFNDNFYPKNTEPKSGRFPHQLLQKLNIPLSIHKINVNNLDIDYAEYDKVTKQRGRVEFKNTSGEFSNVTNQEKFKKLNSFTTAKLTSYLMGQGKLQVDFKFNIISPDGDFSYKGNLGVMDARQLNYVTKPLAMVQVNRCQIKELDFDIDVKKDIAKGKIDFRFNDLSLKILKKQEEGEGLTGMGILSLLANAIVISPDNPSENGRHVIAPINYQRKPSASFFNFLWKTIFQGVKYSVGFTPQKEAEIKQQIAKFKQMKEDRDLRRFKREQRKRLEK